MKPDIDKHAASGRTYRMCVDIVNKLFYHKPPLIIVVVHQLWMAEHIFNEIDKIAGRNPTLTERKPDEARYFNSRIWVRTYDSLDTTGLDRNTPIFIDHAAVEFHLTSLKPCGKLPL